MDTTLLSTETRLNPSNKETDTSPTPGPMFDAALSSPQGVPPPAEDAPQIQLQMHKLQQLQTALALAPLVSLPPSTTSTLPPSPKRDPARASDYSHYSLNEYQQEYSAPISNLNYDDNVTATTSPDRMIHDNPLQDQLHDQQYHQQQYQQNQYYDQSMTDADVSGDRQSATVDLYETYGSESSVPPRPESASAISREGDIQSLDDARSTGSIHPHRQQNYPPSSNSFDDRRDGSRNDSGDLRGRNRNNNYNHNTPNRNNNLNRGNNNREFNNNRTSLPPQSRDNTRGDVNRDNRTDDRRGNNNDRRPVSRSPPPIRRKRDDDDDSRSYGGSKRSKVSEEPDSSRRRELRNNATRSERDEAIHSILRLCDNTEKLDKALELVKALISDTSSSSEKRLSLNEQIAVIRKVMVAACRARRVRIAQQAYELIIDLRASYEPSSADLIELLSMYVATGKADLMSDMVSSVKPSLSVSTIAVLWQTTLVGPKKGRSILVALTKLLLGAMDKTPASNEFFGIVVMDLIAANLHDWVEKILSKLNIGNVPTRSNYSAHMAPRTSIPLKRGVLIAVVEYYISSRNTAGAFECLKYMYDVGYAFHEESLFGCFKLALSGNETDMIDEIFKMVKGVSGMYLSTPVLFDQILAVAVSNDKVSHAIDIVEHMAQTKTRPGAWSSILPVMRLASSLDMLQKFVGVFNVFFTSEGEGGGSAPHSDMDPSLISELVTNCVAHGMFTHAFWYFKYMSHASIPRTHEAYRSLVFALEQDTRGLKAESMGLWTDIGTNQYPISSDQTCTIFKALLLHGGLDAKKAALEIYDSTYGQERKHLITTVNPNALLDFIFYFDRDNEGFALFEDLCDADPTWPSTLTDNVSILLFQKGGDQGRFDVLQLVVDRLRASGQTVPNRQLVRNLIGCLASVRSNDPQRVLLATQIYIWGVKAGTSGYIKTKELSNLNLRLEECWCLLDIRLHLLRCLEWMHREVPKNQINGDLKVFLPPVCSVLNSNPSGNSIVKLKGPVLANCVKYEIKSWFGNKIDVRVETDDRDRDGSKSYLVLAKQTVLDWMAYNFGPTYDTDSIFNCMPEIKDKMFEGGTLLFSKEGREQNQDRKPDYRRNDMNRGNNNRNDGGGNQFRGNNYNRDDRRDDRAGGNNFDRGARHFKRDEMGRIRRDDYGSTRYDSGNNAGGGPGGRDNNAPIAARLDDSYGDASGSVAPVDRAQYDEFEYQNPARGNRDDFVGGGVGSNADDYRGAGRM
ncbi:hypothetical protein HDU79_006482 [Rhizoclosmatium sp. JEL0117]|nr:hypothetical protein HDU79_006482 [Rhizoclosmatium sp. JEL0117]